LKDPIWYKVLDDDPDSDEPFLAIARNDPRYLWACDWDCCWTRGPEKGCEWTRHQPVKGGRKRLRLWHGACMCVFPVYERGVKPASYGQIRGDLADTSKVVAVVEICHIRAFTFAQRCRDLQVM